MFLKNLYLKNLCYHLPFAFNTSTEKPVSEKPVSEKLFLKKTVSEKTVSEKPVSEKPVSEKPVLSWHSPFAVNTSAERPVSEKPVLFQNLFLKNLCYVGTRLLL